MGLTAVSKILILTTAIAIAGCANTTPPPAVQIMPTDCANRVTVINWLEQQSQHPRQSFESRENYERNRAEIRHRIWHLRYRCQPV